MTEDIYHQLATHLAALGMGYPQREELIAILRENFSPFEAEVALALPARVQPMEAFSLAEIRAGMSVAEDRPGDASTPTRGVATDQAGTAIPEDKADSTPAPLGESPDASGQGRVATDGAGTGIPEDKMAKTLERLASRGLIFSGRTAGGQKGYALHQIGFGFPQSFFWKGEDSPTARKMAQMIGNYFKDPAVTREAYGGSNTKSLRYVPVQKSVDRDMQAVYPYDLMERAVEQARTVAVAHCGCRMFVLCRRGASCGYPMEVCLKYDELAEYVIDKGLGREISKETAVQIIKDSEDKGMVHLVDNAVRQVKHTCNCCSCCCWSVGSIKRRRIPRDVLMATYYLRYTDETKCLSCGECVKNCPVGAVKLDGDYPTVDLNWCIGCGVCVAKCKNGAAYLKRRADVAAPPLDFKSLQRAILEERKLA
ncbi:MAG: 4Fe-4S binding protein [Chloroflexi bacterium]|nr:4Fe-4S binding protein [Chloroflexota bacterium]